MPGGKPLSKIPNKGECLKILKDSGCSEEVIEHCIIVTRLAIKIGRLCGADIKIITAGGLLHDVGRSKTHGILHAVEGSKISRRLGLSIKISNIIERHIGAGITKEDAILLSLPPKDYLPITLEEKIISHADNLIATHRKQRLQEIVKKWEKKGMHKPVKRLISLHKELSILCSVDLDNIPL